MSEQQGHSFLTELKRRNVYRVALAYLIAAWFLTQVAATVFPFVGLPDSSVTLVITLLGIGFLPVVIFAWAFEITPDGIRRESEIERSDTDVAQSARKLDVVIIVMLGVALAMFGYDRFGRPPTRPPEITTTDGQPSIAVLPFENRSASPDDVFFVDGVHDDILTSLAKIGSMKVISRTSVEQFKDTERTIREIGEMLGVSMILEGGVQRAGERIRINVQLIDAKTDAHLWAETYNRELTAENIFSIQAEISNTIAIALRTTVSPEEQNRLAVIPTQSLEAYEAYMLGSQRLQRRTGAMVEEAVGYFQRAVGLDPEYALAYIGLADSYALLRSYTNRPWSEVEAPARAAAERAIELDGSLGEAYASLALIEFESENLDAAGPLFERAIAMSPNYATAHQWQGEYFARLDDEERALASLERAADIDPLSPIINYILANQQSRNGLYAAAEARFRKTIEIDPGFARAYQGLALLYFRELGRLDDAAIMANHARLLDPAGGVYNAILAIILGHLGEHEAAEHRLREAQRMVPGNFNVMNVAIINAIYRGDLPGAYEAAELMLDRYPESGLPQAYLTDRYIREGRPEAAQQLFRERFPQLFGEEQPAMSTDMVGAALSAARIYQALDERGMADRILSAVREFLDSDSRSNYPFYLLNIAQLHALQGQPALAIDALRRHFEGGVRYYAPYFLDTDTRLDAIRNDPEFVRLRDFVMNDLAHQRESMVAKWKAEFGPY